ncbi:MAG: helix-hairpin-helix domain-containing protein [Oribacterium sp.]|nr:helix-hairpin-helix domain-containing protein [Oribacterium sp.]MDY6317261.1 helix-hairpin-helix domain-containing protein [Oribacterium sp.]
MTSKEIYEQKQKLAKARTYIMVGLMTVLGICYFTVSRDRVADAPVSTKVSETVAADPTDNKVSRPAETASVQSETPKTAETVSDSSETSFNVERDVVQGKKSETSSIEQENQSSQPAVSESSTNKNIQPTAADGKAIVNLNTATLEELDSLPGVGPSTAKNILDYRTKYGGFATPEEIKNVKRIGDKTYEKLKPYITT